MKRKYQYGFSLIEIAVVLFILVLLLGGLMYPLSTQVEQRKYSDTEKTLEDIRNALLGFVAAHGYLPCPADFAGLSAGHEPTGADHLTGDCSVDVNGLGAPGIYVGYLPAAALGLPSSNASGYALDGWGTTQNRIRYAVSYTTVNSVTNSFTKQNGMRNAGMSPIMTTTLLSVCRTIPTIAPTTACDSAATTLTSNAIAVIWSAGPNAATSGGASATEAKNVKSLANADRVFISTDKSNVAGSEFDDVVTWIAAPTLFNRMIAAGQLP